MNTNEHIFLISFNGVTGKFITIASGIGDVVKYNNKHGIERIKLFNSVKETFEGLSKKHLLSLIDYDTHSLIEVQKTNYL